jgi:hypothetical protein
MNTNNQTIREIFAERVAAKYGPDRDKILGFYDKMLERNNGDQMKALCQFESILKSFTPAAALKVQQENLAKDIAELQKGIEAFASADCKNLLSPVAKVFSEVLKDKKIEVKPAIQRLRDLEAKIAARANKELEVEVGNPRMRVGLIQKKEVFKGGLIERHAEYKSVASNSQCLEIEVTYSR